jgi:hypothetical protein
MVFYENGIDDSDLRVTINCILPGDPSGLSSFEWFEDGKESSDDMKEYEMYTFLSIPAPKSKAKWVRKTIK